MRNSDRLVCEDNRLNWVKDKFSSLGVTLSTRLQDIVEINYKEKLPMLRSMFHSWSKRILTPLGKIVVIRTLNIIPNLNHLFLGFPNPSADLLGCYKICILIVN